MTFVEENKKKYKEMTFEDYYVLLEIEHAKKEIEEAISNGKNCIGWTYDFEDCESIFFKIKINSKEEFIQKYKSGNGVDFRRGFNITYFLERYKTEELKNINIVSKNNNKIDFKYIKRKLRTGLKELGCTDIILFIGPYKKIIDTKKYEKGFWGTLKENSYQKENIIYGWAVYLEF